LRDPARLAQSPRDRARFVRFLDADSDKLKGVEVVFKKLAVQLSASGFLEKKDEFQAAVQEVIEANSVLSEVYGRLLARLDEEEK
jgi:23S rRNA G2069 N7-methylase RlmK/C1962 C5-methylase RlmI